MGWQIQQISIRQQAVDSSCPSGEESETNDYFILRNLTVAIDQLLYQSIFSFKATMIMSIFPTNHAHMEHSRVTRSTSMGEDMIHQYVSLC